MNINIPLLSADIVHRIRGSQESPTNLAEQVAVCIRQEMERGAEFRQNSQNLQNSELRMSGANARTIIVNCHALLRHQFRAVPLWSLVGGITGHGSGLSIQICRTAGLDPHQPAGVQTLKELPASVS